MNRAIEGQTLFRFESDYRHFAQLLDEVLEKRPMRLLGYCLMPTHWHLMLWPPADGDLSSYMHLLTMSHAQESRLCRGLRGLGAVYQGRFQSFPVQNDGHFLTVLRYVERNALRKGLVERAELWPHGSLAQRIRGDSAPQLTPTPLTLPAEWTHLVNQPATAAELEGLHRSIRRGTPYGHSNWQDKIAAELGLESTLNPVGRPRMLEKVSPEE